VGEETPSSSRSYAHSSPEERRKVSRQRGKVKEDPCGGNQTCPEGTKAAIGGRERFRRYFSRRGYPPAKALSQEKMTSRGWIGLGSRRGENPPTSAIMKKKSEGEGEALKKTERGEGINIPSLGTLLMIESISKRGRKGSGRTRIRGGSQAGIQERMLA